MKKAVLCFGFMFIAILLFSACGAEDGLGYYPEPISIQPEKYTGFQMAVSSDLVNASVTPPDTTSEDGKICYFNLNEEECRSFLEGADPVSIGPDGAVLWMNGNQTRTYFVQHGNTIVPLMQSVSRGAEDTAHMLERTLKGRAGAGDTAPTPVDSVRWSPDGRYLFFNDVNKWLGVMMELDDPYLADTETGEIFLIETDGKEKRITDDSGIQLIRCGRFSRDGDSFVYCLQQYNEDHTRSFLLKRYNLSTEELATIWDFGNQSIVYDFCEITDGQWLVLADNTLLMLIPESDMGNRKTVIESMIPNTGATKLIPAAADTVLLCNMNAFRASAFQIVTVSDTVHLSDWYLIEHFDQNGITAHTAQEADEICGNSTLYFREHTGTPFPDIAHILNAQNIGENRFLLNVLYNRTVPDTWDNMYECLYGYVVLDIDTLEMTPVTFTDTRLPDLPDEVRWTDMILRGSDSGHTAFRLTETTARTSAWYEIRQEYDISIMTQRYTCSTGTYGCAVSNGMPQISPAVPETVGVLIETDIRTSDEGIRVGLSYKKDSEEVKYLVPEAVARERFQQLLKAVSKKTQKQIQSCYRFIGPSRLDKYDNKEDLLRKYPALSEQEMYILKDDMDDEKMERLQGWLAQAGYSQEDYDQDAENIAESRNAQSHPVQYLVARELRDGMTCSEVLRLAGLCDMINSRVYRFIKDGDGSLAETVSPVSNDLVNSILQSRQLSEQGDPLLKLISEQYVIDGFRYDVRIDEIQREDNCLTVLLTVRQYAEVP